LMFRTRTPRSPIATLQSPRRCLPSFETAPADLVRSSWLYAYTTHASRLYATMKARSASRHLCRSCKRQCEARAIDSRSVDVLDPPVFHTKMRRHPSSFGIVEWQADLFFTSHGTLLPCSAPSDITGIGLFCLLVDVVLVQSQGSAPSISSHALSELLSRCLGSRQALFSRPPPLILAVPLPILLYALAYHTKIHLTRIHNRPISTKDNVSADLDSALRKQLTRLCR